MIVLAGASGGLGRHLTQELAKDHEIMGLYHTHKPEPVHGNVEFYSVDITSSGDIEEFVANVRTRLERVQLINAAGVSIDGVALRLSEELWNSVISANLTGPFLLARTLLPLMREQCYGRIVNISSVVGHVGVAGTAAYAASKTALDGLTKTLAAENASKNILVNNLALGYFDAGMMTKLPRDLQERIQAGIPLRRLGHPDDVVRAVRFLLECDYVTGTTIHINGGLF